MRFTRCAKVVPQGTFSCGVAAIHLVAPYDKLQATIKEEAKGCDSMAEKICAAAVDAATYAIDKLYSYRVPDELREQVQIGTRVLVPFGFGNKRAEGVVLGFRKDTGEYRLKPVVEALDGLPAHKLHCSVLAEEAIKTAVKDYYDKNNIPYDHSRFPDCENCGSCHMV